MEGEPLTVIRLLEMLMRHPNDDAVVLIRLPNGGEVKAKALPVGSIGAFVIAAVVPQ